MDSPSSAVSSSPTYASTAWTWHDKGDYADALVEIGDNNYTAPVLENDHIPEILVTNNEITAAGLTDNHTTDAVLHDENTHKIIDEHTNYARSARGCRLGSGKGSHPYAMPNKESELDLWRRIIPGGLSKGGKGCELDGRGPAIKIVDYDGLIRLADWISPEWRKRSWMWQGQLWKITTNVQTGLDQWVLSSEADKILHKNNYNYML